MANIDFLKEKLETLTPKEIVKKLDLYIIGQHKAKKSVAIALRNRTRRLRLPEDIREEIAPKNILMIGPTGVGKTEIARRLAKLCGAPFLKVEATKYTEVGYVGRDVESMIRDLMSVGYSMVKSEMQKFMKGEAACHVEDILLDLLLPSSGNKTDSSKKTESYNQLEDKTLGAVSVKDEARSSYNTKMTENTGSMSSTREKFRQMLKDGKLEDREVEVQVQKRNNIPTMEVFAGGNLEDLESSMANLTNMLSGSRSRKKKVSIREAREIILQEQLDKMIDPDKVSDEAKHRVEQMGIVFIDEIDKIAVRGQNSGSDVSREGVQRDILPIVEGSTVNTKHGVVDTSHILFIAAGAFSLSKPSDLIPELQGRFPLRVELESLHADDFKRILLEPKNALTRQYAELLKTEGVEISFREDAIDKMSSLAAEVNSRMENIGARRLHTIMETLLEELSFEADEHSGETIEITSDYVEERLKNIVKDQDLSKYIL
ncbi:MAG: ATP-dependent protease ATPase subunit HslU [Treponemataceae bacterium]